MTASNHTITGICIAASISNPVVALPLAFFAHFALDALPHFGFKTHTSKYFNYVLSADMGLALALLISLALLQPSNWQVLVAGGVLCASPDLMWLPRWLNELRGKDNPDMGLIRRFNARIQWGEQQTWFGVACEVAWFCVIFVVVVQQLQ